MVSNSLLEGIYLGLVYTAKSHGGKEEVKDTKALDRDWNGRGGEETKKGREMLGGKEGEEEGGMMKCLGDAIRRVVELRQLEGTMEFERGKVRYLIYRVD